jgi:hypothetical protein
MLVSDVISATSADIRQVISTTDDPSLFLSWIDRVHKECLHSTVYNNLIQSMESISLVANTSMYTLGTAPRDINFVYDRTFDREIKKLGSESSPTGATPADSITNSQWVQYYRLVGSTGLYVFPAPQKSIEDATLEVYYEQDVTTLTSTTQTLLIPDDGIDLVVAGTNFYAFSYLKSATDAQVWGAKFEALKGN